MHPVRENQQVMGLKEKNNLERSKNCRIMLTKTEDSNFEP